MPTENTPIAYFVTVLNTDGTTDRGDLSTGSLAVAHAMVRDECGWEGTSAAWIEVDGAELADSRSEGDFVDVGTDAQTEALIEFDREQDC